MDYYSSRSGNVVMHGKWQGLAESGNALHGLSDSGNV